jgi:CheY-like chemotaxis protein
MNGLHKPKILIVDDISINLKVQALLFTKHDYDVLIANNAIQALVIAEEKQPDIIIADIMMPEIDGIELCRRLKLNALTKDIPVFFLSADTSKTTIEKAFEVGGCDYLSKPFNDNELFLKVKKHLYSNHFTFIDNPSKGNIAVVDDNQLNRHILNDFLGEGDFNSYTFESASDLFEVKDLNVFDMILLDIEMPILNGWKTFEILRIKKFNKPIIAISAYADHIFKDKCIKHGFNDVIYKPIYKSNILNTIVKHLKPVTEPIEIEPCAINEMLNLTFFYEVTQSDIPYRVTEYQEFINLIDKIISSTKNSIHQKKTTQALLDDLHKYLNVGHYFCDKAIVDVVKSIEKRIRFDKDLINEEGAGFLTLMQKIQIELKNNSHVKSL